jgi:hypothetical protein
MDKKEEETQAMDKPKPLEVVSDGDLSEIKKDPEETKKAWEVWLEKTRGDDWDAEDKEHEEMSRPIKCTSCGKTKPRILYENPLGKPKGICDECASPPADGAPEPKWITDMQNDDDTDENPKTSKKAWEVWLDNVTKPIPDSKGGRGSFQHCINANKDKKNPGGWCKQIERKIGKGKDEGEEEEVKISTYKKLTRIKDRLQAHNKGLGALGEGKLNRKTGKPMKLKPRKITLDEFESEKPIDEKARKKREAKEKTDYFVEEIRSNIIYHNKILPILGMIAGQAARGIGGAAKKIGPKLLSDVGAVGQDMLQQDEEEEQ